MTGDMVAVETDSGYDIGKITLSGELVKLQMKKRKADLKNEYPNILRKAQNADLEKLLEGRSMEGATMLRARVIARELNLNMKIGDVEYQGDKRKATFYFIADGRVDFRELIKIYAREFKVKIEMRQIGARQEAGKIGGLGSCGRELCCSTWLQDFKSVSTNAARYQNLSINQTKLSGQCGRLKCCLNYELDTYTDALKAFPDTEILQTQQGDARLVKRDIFKKHMVFEFQSGGKQFALPLEKVSEIYNMNRRNEKPASLDAFTITEEIVQKETEFVDVTGQLSLKTIEKASHKRRQNQKQQNKKQQNKQQQKPKNTAGLQGSSKNKKSVRNHNPNQQNKNNPNKRIQSDKGKGGEKK